MSKFWNWIGEMVRAQSPSDFLQRARMENFVAVRLMWSVLLFASFVPWIAFGGSFAYWQAPAFACLLSPLIAVLMLFRGAPFGVVQTVSAFGPLMLSLILAYAGPEFGALAFCVLLISVVEAVSAGHLRQAVGACAVACVAFTAICFSNGMWEVYTTSTWIAPALLLLMSYSCGIAWAHARMTSIAESRERRTTMRHEALAQTIGDLVLRQDRTGSVVFASREALSLFGVSPRDMMGRGLFHRIHVADRPAYLKAVADAIEYSETVATTVRMRRGHFNDEIGVSADPVFAWVEMRLRRIPVERRADDPADSADVVTIARDVSAAKSAEEDLCAAREAAEVANVWKDRFLANVSHELRTPLNAIIGFAEILSNADLAPSDPARAREYASIIHSSGQHLLEMVNSILDMSKIDAGSFDILPEPFELPRLLDQCCDMMGLKATQGQVLLERDYPAHLEELVADKRACKQIIINLLSNAVKFTPPGGRVTLHARPEGAFFIIAVEDTGIGINATDLTHIGNPFFQAQSDTTRAYEGTGLGLSLVRGLVGLHGGAISMESASGGGTTVTVKLPSHCAPQKGVQAKIEKIVRLGVQDGGAVEVSKQAVKKIA